MAEMLLRSPSQLQGMDEWGNKPLFRKGVEEAIGRGGLENSIREGKTIRWADDKPRAITQAEKAKDGGMYFTIEGSESWHYCRIKGGELHVYRQISGEETAAGGGETGRGGRETESGGETGRGGRETESREETRPAEWARLFYSPPERLESGQAGKYLQEFIAPGLSLKWNDGKEYAVLGAAQKGNGVLFNLDGKPGAYFAGIEAGGVQVWKMMEKVAVEKSTAVSAALHELLNPVLEYTENRQPGRITNASYLQARKKLLGYLSGLDEAGKAEAAGALCGDLGGADWMAENQLVPFRGMAGEYAAKWLDANKPKHGARMAFSASSKDAGYNLEIERKLLYEAMGEVSAAWIGRRMEEDAARADFWDGKYFPENDCMYTVQKYWYRLFRHVVAPKFRERMGLCDVHHEDGRGWMPNRVYQHCDGYEIESRHDFASGDYAFSRLIDFAGRNVMAFDKAAGAWKISKKRVDWSEWDGAQDALSVYGRPINFAFGPKYRQNGGLMRQIELKLEGEREAGKLYLADLGREERELLCTGNYDDVAVAFAVVEYGTAKEAQAAARAGDIIYTVKSPNGTSSGHTGQYAKDAGGKGLTVYNTDLKGKLRPLSPEEFFARGGWCKKIYRLWQEHLGHPLEY